MKDEITREALIELREKYVFWLSLKHTNDAERELATIKINLIHEMLA